MSSLFASSSSVRGAGESGPRHRQHQHQQQARSFGGCDTCRRRRIKCDESRPGCTRCRKSMLTCPGYPKNIVFQLDDDSSSPLSAPPSSSNGSRRAGFRRLLFSEAARREMSRGLVTSVPGNITECLNEIDEAKPQAGGSDEHVDVGRGPFNVFAATKQATPQLTPPDEIPFLGDYDDGFLPNLGEMPQLGLWDSDLDLDLGLGLDTTGILNSPRSHRSHDAAAALDYAAATSSWPTSHLSVFDPVVQLPASQLLDTTHAGCIEERSTAGKASSPVTQSLLLPDSTSIPRSLETTSREMQSMLFLVDHFTTTVVAYMTPRYEKTLWHILFVPHMRECVALLMLNKPISHADQAIFKGFSAISAQSIGGTCGSQMWLDKSERYRERSYEACQIMLQGAYDNLKKYKYKRILMALVVAVLMSTLKGDPVTEEYYFLEMEKLIKLKGLGRKNSRKAQMLHRFYAFERLIYESTCMRGIDFKHRQRITNDVNSVSVIPYPDDNMAFRVPDWGSLDNRAAETDTSQPDAEEFVENEVLGLWPDALCPQVAGIPAQWIKVLLHIVLLGKHKDAVEQAGRSDTEHLEEFLGRAKTLETCIQKQVLQIDLASISDSVTGRKPSGDSWLNVLDCFRNALHIYFYRRIYDIPSPWLQDKVEKVRHCLIRIAEGHPEQSGSSHHSGSIGVLWASFIASCEAEGDDLQAFFTDWYRQAATKTGISTWLNSLSLSQQIWRAKRTAGGKKTTWIDVLRKQQRDILQQMPSQEVPSWG